MRRRRGIRWRRVVVWWVCLTVVMVGLEVATILWNGSRMPAGRPSPLSGFSSRVAPYNDYSYGLVYSRALCTRAATAPNPFIHHPLGWPSTRRPPRVDPRAHEGFQHFAGDALEPAIRLWDVLVPTHDSSGPAWMGVATESRLLVPLGVMLVGNGPTRIPASVHSTYPVVVRLDADRRFLLLRPRSALGIAAALSAVIVMAPVAFVGARRMLRRRRGRCVWCGYSLAGIGGDAVCPECGESR